MKIKIAIAFVVLACLSGCLSFGVEDKNNIAVTGANYSNETSALVDEYIKSMNSTASAAEVDNAIKLREYVLANPASNPIKPESQLIEMLSTTNNQLLENTLEALKLKASLDSVNDYFMGLQALVDDPTAERNVLAVAQLADNVNGLNNALKKDVGEPVISEEKRNALIQLTKVVSDQIHARKVKKALIRDREVIAMALYLQGEVLNSIQGEIFRALNSDLSTFYAVKIENPYLKQSSDMNDQWVANNLLYLNTSASMTEIKARQTSRDDEMNQINLWSSALEGKYDPSLVNQQIQDIKKLIYMKTAVVNSMK